MTDAMINCGCSCGCNRLTYNAAATDPPTCHACTKGAHKPNFAMPWARSHLMALRMEEHFSKEEIHQFMKDLAQGASATRMNLVKLVEGGWEVDGCFIPSDPEELKRFLEEP